MIAACSKTKARNRLIKECDKLATELCFARDHHRCCRCGKGGVQWAHVISRRHLAIRWDLDNNMSLCGGCHRFWWHVYPLEAAEWFSTTFPERYERIRAIHRMKIKTDLQLWLIVLRAEVQKLPSSS